MNGKNKGNMKRNQELVEANSQSDDPYQQFEWLRRNGDLSKKQSVEGMVNWVTDYFDDHRGKITLEDGSIKRLMNGFSKAINYMQENDQEEKYASIYNDIQHILNDIVQKRYNRDN